MILVTAIRTARAGRPFTELADLVLPRACVGCARPGRLLCPSCQGPAEPFAVASAGAGTQVPTYATGVYEGGLRSAVVAYKERGRRDLAPILSQLLGLAVSAAVLRASPTAPAPAEIRSIVMVAVPSSRSAARGRGGAHLPRLVRRIARHTDLVAAPDALCLRRSVRDSVGLSVAERVDNVAGAMEAVAAPRVCRRWSSTTSSPPAPRWPRRSARYRPPAGPSSAPPSLRPRYGAMRCQRTRHDVGAAGWPIA